MLPGHFYLAALVCYTVGAGFAFASLRIEALRKTGWQLLAVGLGGALQTVGIGFYCTQDDSHFFTSISEIFLLLSWALGAGYLLVLAAWAMRSLGILILPLIVLLLGMSLLLGSTGLVPVGDTANHPLFAIHIISAFLGYGLYLTAVAASIIYLQQGRLLKRKSFGWALRGLPSLEKLEKAETLCVWLGLGLFTIAVGTGANIAEHSGLKDWYFEPKILSTWVTWFIIFFLAIGRITKRLAGRATAKIILVGGVFAIFTFLISHPFHEARAARTPPGKSNAVKVSLVSRPL